MFFKPLRQSFARHLACRKIEHQSFLFIDRRHYLGPIQNQEDFHRGMGHTLVAIQKRMIHRQREAERGGFGVKRLMQVGTAETGSWLCEGGFQGAEITNSRGSAGIFTDRPVKCDDFPERQIPHSG